MSANPWRNVRFARKPWKRAAALLVLLALAAGGAVSGRPVLAAPAPQALSIALQPVAEGLDQPVSIAQAGDGSGRLFIVEQPGRIRVYDGAQLRPAPFLDITPLVNSSGSEQGLLGLAFDPDYATNGYFYVDYTGKSGIGDTVVARYRRSTNNPNVADPASALVLLTITQPQANHNGGELQFGPDGFLYIATGDGGGGGDDDEGHNPAIGNGQDLSTLLGKILRIDVRNSSAAQRYAIPPNNPFVNTQGARHEIWAYGLRNPWRFSFDHATGDMLIGDVGQGSWEEIDFQPAGAGGKNYGWRCREGDQPFNMSTPNCSTAAFVPPILVYDHAGGRCAVTGGYRYRGTRYPQLLGVYFYADYCSGQIWGGQPSGSRWTEQELLNTTALISSFGESQSGELYFADHGGTIYHIVATDTSFVYLPMVRR